MLGLNVACLWCRINSNTQTKIAVSKYIRSTMGSFMMKLYMTLKKKFFVGNNVSAGFNFHIGLLSWISCASKLSIGNDVYVGKFCTIQCNGVIGDGTLIANNVGIVGRRDHNFRQIGKLVRHSDWIGSCQYLSDDNKNWIDIGPDVWIGYGAILVSGIKVGRGAIISAGSVVIHDILPYDIVAGNPAKRIGRRFSDRDIVEHERLLTEICI